jgi:hypothetical protein
MGNMKEPRPQTGTRLVALAVPKETEKDLLGQVLGILAVTQSPKELRVNAAAKPGNEFSESLGVVLLDMQHQGYIGVGSPAAIRGGLCGRIYSVFQ